MTIDIHAVYQEAEKNGGLLKTNQIENIGIARWRIPELVAKGTLVKESKGLYMVPAVATDEYAVIQHRSDKLVYSYGTALFFLGISDRVPRIIDITVPQGYNVIRIRDSYPNLRFHYVKPELLLLGAEKIATPQGAEVTAYNKERCICDIIKARNKTDKQLFTQAVKEYFSGDFKPGKLLKIAKLLGVEAEVRTYMEVL